MERALTGSIVLLIIAEISFCFTLPLHLITNNSFNQFEYEHQYYYLLLKIFVGLGLLLLLVVFYMFKNNKSSSKWWVYILVSLSIFIPLIFIILMNNSKMF